MAPPQLRPSHQEGRAGPDEVLPCSLCLCCCAADDWPLLLLGPHCGCAAVQQCANPKSGSCLLGVTRSHITVTAMLIVNPPAESPANQCASAAAACRAAAQPAAVAVAVAAAVGAASCAISSSSDGARCVLAPALRAAAVPQLPRSTTAKVKAGVVAHTAQQSAGVGQGAHRWTGTGGAKGAHPAAMEGEDDATLRALFDQVDKNSNGRLDRTEVRWQRAFGQA